MRIETCTLHDVDAILELYEAARMLQQEKQMVVWPRFERAFLEKEIEEGRQWKLVQNDMIVCNWAIAFEDKEIWEERDQSNAIYIHRIATHPAYRGQRFIDALVDWAKAYAKWLDKRYVRLDTLGNNTKLIWHYTSAGFAFLGMVKLTETVNLPQHYQAEPNCCLFEIDLQANHPGKQKR
ncbi:GNAT family N-acetyltransferase [Flavisolibacter sp. BT320]|nr:GNAT family N-acetyltransferase [Flavisolibacter longurius]